MIEKEKNSKQIELSCDIVGDLLPLFYDNVVSEETKEAVSRHLARCEKCSKEYTLLKEELPETDNCEESEIKESQIRIFLKKVRKRGLLKGIVVGMLVVSLLVGAGYVLTEVPMISPSSGEVSIKYVFEEDGNIFIVYSQPQYTCPTAFEQGFDKEKKAVTMSYKVPVIHFVDGGESWNAMALEKANMGDFQPEHIFYDDKEIYTFEDSKNKREAPEFVKVYLEYSNSEYGFNMGVDEKGISLARITAKDGRYTEINGFKEWDWEGNLIYDGTKEESGDCEAESGE